MLARSHLHASLLLVLLASSTAFALSCARDKEPETAYAQGQVGTAGFGGQPGYAQGGAAGGYAYAPVAGGTGVPGAPIAGTAGLPYAAAGAGGVPAVTTPSSPMATPIDAAAASIVQPVLTQLARTHTVAGAKPLGSPLVGNFQAGQKLEGPIQLQPNKCYTVVATALPPVTELNVQLVATTVLPALSPVLAVDNDTGTTAVIGKKPNCYKWALPLPAPAKLVVEVAQGTGLAAAQIYEK